MRRHRLRSTTTSFTLAAGLVTAGVLVSAPAGTATASTWETWVSSPDDTAVRLASRTPSPSAPTAMVLVDPADRHQTWTGVGASLTDSSVALMTPDIVDRLYGPTRSDGAHLNLLRLPLSATDFSTEGWTWKWRNRTGTVKPPAQALAALDALDHIRAARSDLDVIASPWTAPANWKTNRDIRGGSLRSNKVGRYGQMLSAQAAWLVDRNVPISALAIGNEPGHAGDYPSMLMSDDQMVSIAGAIGDDLDALGVELHALDHNWSDRSRAETLVSSGNFDAVAFHCYGGSPDQMAGFDVPVLVTECTGTTDHWYSTFGWDARELVVNAARAGSTGLYMWNLVLDDAHGPKADWGCADCRGLLTVDRATGEVEPTPEFYTLAHVARAAAPGSVRVASSDVPGLPIVAFDQPDGSIGVFGQNDTGSAQTLAIHVRDGASLALDLAAGEMFTARTTDTTVTDRVVPAGLALTDATNEVTQTEWVCAAASGAPPSVSSFRLGEATAGERANCILRAPEGDAHVVGDDGLRHWIPDGATWFCEVDRGTPIVDTTRHFVDTTPEGAWHHCTT